MPVWCLKIPREAMPTERHRWFLSALQADPHVAKVEVLQDEHQNTIDEWVVLFRDGHTEPKNVTLHRLGEIYRSELNAELHEASKGEIPKSRYERLDEEDDAGV